jgi:adenylate cyclase
VIPRALRFRHFSLRILTALLGLLFTALATTYIVVSRANATNARDHARADLERAARIVDDAIKLRIEVLSFSAKIMAGDDAIKQTRIESDSATLASLLVSYVSRTGAPLITFYDDAGALVASSDAESDNENTGPFRYLIGEATKNDLSQNSGFSYFKEQLNVLVVVPLYAPHPNVFGWFGLAYPIDRDFAEKIKAITRVELTFIASDPPVLAGTTTSNEILREGRVLATTLPPAAALATRDAAVAMARSKGRGDPMEIISLPDDRYVTLYKWQEMLGESPITIVLQRPLTPELESARETENALLLTSLLSLAAATILSLLIARSVSEPVRQLATHTEKIAAGDYATRLQLGRVDELGQLAEAMNQMSAGLDERDRVRDLLDKNVSPEVAAQLLRDGAILGGQERAVTVLFADLRGFTTLSEKLTPQDLLALLNRYLDRMSTAIEAEGGVIDKFIGDEIMALFGAPVAQPDAPDRALTAALAMERALTELNREFAVEGIAPLALGIGINTAQVIAGNIGSQRRLNYSVIGDGVNVASRLQSLTRTAEFRTNIITSSATLAAARAPQKFQTRPLGTVAVKGRAEPVEIFAVEASVSPGLPS